MGSSESSSADPLDISDLNPAHQRHIVALGLIADFSAIVEWQARWVMGLALGLEDADVIAALFLGERFASLARRMKALAAAPNKYGVKALDPGEAAEILEWIRVARGPMERRDALIHRPVIKGVRGPTLAPARRSQRPEELDAQGSCLVLELRLVVKRGGDLMFGLALG